MSIVDNKTVDGIALTDDNNGIILLIADHMDWRDEYQHLVMLQEKINVYITFLEQKQYEDIYKGENITYGIIENQRIIAGNAQFTGIAAGRGVRFTTGLLLLGKGLGMRETPIRPHSWH